jgi:hypothetical protein
VHLIESLCYCAQLGRPHGHPLLGKIRRVASNIRGPRRQMRRRFRQSLLKSIRRSLMGSLELGT